MGDKFPEGMTVIEGSNGMPPFENAVEIEAYKGNMRQIIAAAVGDKVSDRTDRREIALLELAERLHFLMEKFDPTEDGKWSALTDRQRDFYRLCVEGLLVDRGLVSAALASTVAQAVIS